MMDKALGGLIAIIGLASLAVIVSKRSDTAKVLTTLIGGINNLLKTAISPIK